MAHYGGVGTDVNSSAHWLIERASQSLKENNTYEAKAWLITAKTLYPKDFGVQYEAYRIEKNAARVQESAKLFCDMFQQFPDRSVLWEEVASFTEALEGNLEDHRVKFLTDLFSSIPHHAQREILLKAAGRCKDCIEKCRIMLLLMRRFPDVIPKNGVMLTEMLTYAEDSEYPYSAVNPYRKLLVCDVLPHLLASDNISVDSTRGSDIQDDEDCSSGISHQQVYKWFELSIEFYVACATTQNQMTEDSRDHQSYIDTSIIAEVLDGKGPWVVLHQHFHLLAKKCGWNEICRIQDRIDPEIYRNIGDYWSSITELHHKLKKITKHNTADERAVSDVPEKTGVMFATIILFLQTVWEYCSTVNRCDMPATTPGSVPLLVLIEESIAENALVPSTTSITQAAGDDSSPVPKKKKRKGSCGECGSPVKEDSKNKPFANIIIDKSCGSASSNLSKDFAIAVEAWHILNTHADYKNRFSQLSNNWNIDQWHWMSTFKVDRLLYKGKYKKAIEFLQEQRLCLEQDSSSNQELLIRGAVQLSCCYFHLGDHKGACEEALYALHLFARREATEENVTLKRSTAHVQGKLESRVNESTGQPSSYSGRCFRLIQCSEVEVLSFSVRLILSSLKQRLANEGRNDEVVGHVIVLLQFGWPKEEKTFYQLVETIRSQGGLKYKRFFNYVNNIDILEEFAHLNSDDSYHLDLLPQSTSGTSRAVTRGVNKGAKEEFRLAMERQVRRSEENLEPLLKAFFQEERNSLLNGSHYLEETTSKTKTGRAIY